MPVIQQPGSVRLRQRFIGALGPTLGSVAEALLPGELDDPTLGMLPVTMVRKAAPAVKNTAVALQKLGWRRVRRGLPDDFHEFIKTDSKGKKHLLVVSDLGEWTHQLETGAASNKLLDSGYGHKEVRELAKKLGL